MESEEYTLGLKFPLLQKHEEYEHQGQELSCSLDVHDNLLHAIQN
jgi:hypothetical protein